MNQIPTKDQIRQWINENPTLGSKRDIAKAFGIKGDARLDLKRLLKEMEAEGGLEVRERKFRAPGALPPVSVLLVLPPDASGEDVAEMVSIGTLFAFLVVSIAVVVLRRTRPKLKRPFRTPQVPILPIGFHYPDQIIHVGPLFETSEDVDADIKRLRDFYAPFQGKNRGIN